MMKGKINYCDNCKRRPSSWFLEMNPFGELDIDPTLATICQQCKAILDDDVYKARPGMSSEQFEEFKKNIKCWQEIKFCQRCEEKYNTTQIHSCEDTSKDWLEVMKLL